MPQAIPESAPYDAKAAVKAIADFLIVYMGGNNYANANDVPADVTADMGAKLHDLITAATGAVGEVSRLRQIFESQRLVHLPTPTTPVRCQECSLGGDMVAWPCGPWKLIDLVLADTRG